MKFLIIWILIFMVISVSSAQEDQPLTFSHKIHSLDNSISCQYCHIHTKRSDIAGIPSMSNCIGCHGTMEIPLISENVPNIDKIHKFWFTQKTIPWIKIHDIPDFVRFSHKEHILADSIRFIDDAGKNCNEESDPRSLDCRIKLYRQGGDVICESCHGYTKSMDVVKVVDSDFGNMGWCLSCHLQVKGSKERKSMLKTIDAWYDTRKKEAERELKIGMINKKGYHNTNVTDCLSCHY